ncbi:MAG: type I 3-dehydroquinate dehydratase [Gemmatimonadetes bacterium]|nr:type I 3-dehydroquinate dehydratase [Gemmatimonadota bacterium]
MPEWEHSFWATVSGSDLDDILAQQRALWDWGVSAIEIRTDLVPEYLHTDVLQSVERRGPVYVAHFGTGADASDARQSLFQALETDGVDGIICHSWLDSAQEMRQAAAATDKQFAAACHSQTPLTLDELLREYDAQAAFEPLFRKIAARAFTVPQALALLEATHRAAQGGGSPIVGAVFGPHRWARVAMPSMGSAITFIIARPLRNEVGGDDEQLTIPEATLLIRVRGIAKVPDGDGVFATAGVSTADAVFA